MRGRDDNIRGGMLAIAGQGGFIPNTDNLNANPNLIVI